MTDCTAVPAADPGIWLVVRCGGKVSYPVDRFGRLVAPRPAPPSL
jgi:hypothetical protein